MKQWWLSVAVLGLLTSTGLGDVVTLKNGTKIEGIVFKFDTEYRIKQADGVMKTVKVKDVASVTKGAAAIATAPESAPTAGGAAAQPTGPDTIVYDGQRMTIAEHLEFVVALKSAMTWTPRDPWAVRREPQSLRTLARYPRSLQANCALASYHLRVLDERPMETSHIDAALGPLNRALAINPQLYDIWAMVAVAQRKKGRLAESLEASLKTFRLHPSEETAQGVFLDAMMILEGQRAATLPPALRRAAENAKVEVAAYPNRQSMNNRSEWLFGVGGAEQLLPRLPEHVPGQIDVGSGFMLTENGCIIVPKSLLHDGADVWVFLKKWDVTQAQVLAVDPVRDLALLKIDADTALPCAAPDSNPADGNLYFNALRYGGELNGWGHGGIRFKDGALEENSSILKGAPAFEPGGVAAMWVGGTNENPNLVSGAEILDFVNANSRFLHGAKPGGGISFANTLVMYDKIAVAIFVVEKGSPPPWSPAPTTQPGLKESSPSPAE
jgi:hypothetical protein